MHGTKASPADFKRLVKKVVENPYFHEYQVRRDGKGYKIVYVFLLDDTDYKLRVEFLAGDVNVCLWSQGNLHKALKSWKPEELAQLAQAAKDAETIVDAFYSVDQSTVR